MHTPEIRQIVNNLWTHFEEILRENWKVIYNEEKFYTSYLDNDKEVTLRFRVKDKEDSKVILEIEKEIDIKKQKRKEKQQKEREKSRFKKSKYKQLKYKIARLKWIQKWIQWKELTNYYHSYEYGQYFPRH